MQPNIDPTTRAEHERLTAAAATALSELSTSFEDALARGDLGRGRQVIGELSAILEEVKAFRAALSRRERFMADLSVVVHGDCEVSLKIPAGWSRARLIREAYEISAQAHGRAPMDISQLQVWQEEEGFLSVLPQSTRVHVLGLVPGTENKCYQEQREVLRSLGLEQASPADTVVAHMAFHVATGRDFLLQGDVFISCLTKGYLVNYPGQLWHFRTDADWGRAGYIGAAGRRPS